MAYRKLSISVWKFSFVFGLLRFAHQVGKKKSLERWSPSKTEEIVKCEKEIQEFFTNRGYREASLLALCTRHGVDLEKVTKEWIKERNEIQPPAERTVVRLNVLIEANKEALDNVVLDIAPSFGWYIVDSGDAQYNPTTDKEPEIWKLFQLVQSGKVREGDLQK